MSVIKPYLKALVALGILIVAVIGTALGIDTGLDPEVQVVVAVAAISGGVWAIPNSMNNFLTKNAKAIVAALMVAVAYGATALGIDVGIDVDAQLQVVALALITGAAVWGTSNSEVS